MTNTQSSPNSFDSLPLSNQVARAINDLEYQSATDIQAAAIPCLLQGRDLIGKSSTGTGKTAAFGIPAVECIDGDIKRPQVLVISPTRELALQISGEMRKYAKYKEGVSIATVYGGASMTDQIRQLRKANVVIGTPGRIMDHMRRKTLKLDELKMVVLDEADEMLSMGFIDDIQEILSKTPDNRQTVLFSATMPPPILKITKEFLTNPEIVDTMSGEDNQADIQQTFYYVKQHQKPEALSLLLKFSNSTRSIVFCNTKSMVDELAAMLRKSDMKATGLHGDMTQAMRTQVMEGFRSGNIEILIATDVAARGIDVDNVDVVINFDIPQSFEYYVHRIGRTGRAGKQGLSQTLVSNSKQLSTLKNLMRFTGKEITEENLPNSGDMMERAVANTANELMVKLHEPTGKAAQMLVKRLVGNEENGVSAYQVACVLAQQLVGSDDKYKTIQAPSRGKKSDPFGLGGGAADDGVVPMVKVSANIGRNARVTPNHFVGSIAEFMDIPGNSIGKIEIGQEKTIIGLREDIALALTGTNTTVRINGISVNFSMFGGKKRSSAPSPMGFKNKTPRKSFRKVQKRTKK